MGVLSLGYSVYKLPSQSCVAVCMFACLCFLTWQLEVVRLKDTNRHLEAEVCYTCLVQGLVVFESSPGPADRTHSWSMHSVFMQ